MSKREDGVEGRRATAGVYGTRQVDWIRVRILRSDTDSLMRLFPDFKSSAGQLHQMIQSEIQLFNFARPLKDGEAICKGGSGGPVYTEVGGQLLIYGVTSGVLSDPKIGNPKCDKSFIQMIAPIQSERSWILSRIARARVY